MLKLGEILFKYRDYTPVPFMIAMIVYAQSDQQSLLVGLVFMVIGEVIRTHGVAYIGGVSRTRSYSTGQKLITGGPFAHVRNPLYIGNLGLSVGLVIASNVGHWFTALFVLTFFLQYIPVVNWEENNLRNVFGEDFDVYCSKVPRWIPRISAADHDFPKIEGDYKMAIKSEKNTLMIALVLLGLVLWQSGWFQMAAETVAS